MMKLSRVNSVCSGERKTIPAIWCAEVASLLPA